ncbi:MAG: hypothetical protein ACI81S_000397 [Sphingobacteriales bacterium]|jgi:hypothetical protein
MTPKLTLNKRIELLALLGKHLRDSSSPGLEELIIRAKVKNEWFQPVFIKKALESWSLELTQENLTLWMDAYKGQFDENKPAKTVGLILAGNIPLVGWHDILSVFISGNKSLIKVSSKDEELIRYCVNYLIDLEPEVANWINFTERLADFQAVIATGSDNSSRYFDSYFGKYPNIIRKSRQSVAVIKGNEDQDALNALGSDVFTYFGLGCRNVSHIYIPTGYKPETLLDAFEDYSLLMDNFKYQNNYDYTKTIFLLNRIPHLDTGYMIFAENESLTPRLASINYSFYDDVEVLKTKLAGFKDQIQCISSNFLDVKHSVKLGDTQKPRLWDYADGVDTMKFLLGL